MGSCLTRMVQHTLGGMGLVSVSLGWSITMHGVGIDPHGWRVFSVLLGVNYPKRGGRCILQRGRIYLLRG